MDEDGPRIVRPVPRRPFDPSFINPTPPDDDASGTIPHHELLASRLLRLVDEQPPAISSPPSYMNLTSSTLAGIYSPGPSDGGDEEDEPYFKEYEEEEEEEEEVLTPLEIGSQTPAERAEFDDEGLRMRSKPHAARRDSIYSSTSAETNSDTLSRSPTLSLILRAALLFTLGTGYGVLVTRFHTGGHFAPLPEGIITSDLDWRYLVFWGIAGVFLGSSLPMFDKVWESHERQNEAKETMKSVDDETAPTVVNPSMDWALVVRAIGAFVGIAFAIRKLSWDSTLQLSATMALVNPLLWWLIDRSTPGFLLSAFVSIAGSALLLGVNPEMVPTPSSLSSSLRDASSRHASSEQLPLGGLASMETVETGIWILSILFCSCLCFGNIGRRLTQSQSAVSKGRWGGLR